MLSPGPAAASCAWMPAAPADGSGSHVLVAADGSCPCWRTAATLVLHAAGWAADAAEASATSRTVASKCLMSMSTRGDCRARECVWSLHAPHQVSDVHVVCVRHRVLHVRVFRACSNRSGSRAGGLVGGHTAAAAAAASRITVGPAGKWSVSIGFFDKLSSGRDAFIL